MALYANPALSFAGDTDSLTIAFSHKVSSMEDMLMDSVLRNPTRYRQYQETKAALISDDSLEGNTTYGKWAVERRDINEAIFLGCKFYALAFEDGSVLKQVRGLKVGVLNEISIDQLRPLLHDPTLGIDGVNDVFRHHRNIMSTTKESKTVTGSYKKRVFVDDACDETMSIDKYNRLML